MPPAASRVRGSVAAAKAQGTARMMQARARCRRHVARKVQAKVRRSPRWDEVMLGRELLQLRLVQLGEVDLLQCDARLSCLLAHEFRR